MAFPNITLCNANPFSAGKLMATKPQYFDDVTLDRLVRGQDKAVKQQVRCLASGKLACGAAKPFLHINLNRDVKKGGTRVATTGGVNITASASWARLPLSCCRSEVAERPARGEASI